MTGAEALIQQGMKQGMEQGKIEGLQEGLNKDLNKVKHLRSKQQCLD